LETVDLVKLLVVGAVGLHLLFELARRLRERAYAVVEVSGETHVLALRKKTRLRVGGSEPQIGGGWTEGKIDCPAFPALNGKVCRVMLLAIGHHNVESRETAPAQTEDPNPTIWYWGPALALAALTVLVLLVKPELGLGAVNVGMGIILAVQAISILVAVFGNDKGVVAIRSVQGLMLRRVGDVVKVFTRVQGGNNGWGLFEPDHMAVDVEVLLRWPKRVGCAGPPDMVQLPILVAQRVVFVPLGGGCVM
jgi:hypothetical protein